MLKCETRSDHPRPSSKHCTSLETYILIIVKCIIDEFEMQRFDNHFNHQSVSESSLRVGDIDFNGY